MIHDRWYIKAHCTSLNQPSWLNIAIRCAVFSVETDLNPTEVRTQTSNASDIKYQAFYRYTNDLHNIGYGVFNTAEVVQLVEYTGTLHT